MFSIVREKPAPQPELPKPKKRLDALLLVGLLIAIGAVLAGIAFTGAGILYFLQPVAAAIVFGGTLGVLLITTPSRMIRHAARRVASILFTDSADPARLIEDIVQAARVSRKHGPAAIQTAAATIADPFLRDALLLSLDVERREDLQSAIETEVRLRERQGEADAKTLEVAGGFAPTIGILGTVVGLIEVLRHFSDFLAVGAGIGTAFVSTIYGLALANLVLLPLAHRIRANVAETFETQELVLEGVLCIADGLHPSLIRLKLNAFLRESKPSAGKPVEILTAAANG